jgi:hypothetical protein
MMGSQKTVFSFEHEALRFVLDQDSLQNLARLAATEWQLGPEDVIEAAKRLAGAGLVRLYREDGTDVDPAGLSPADLDSPMPIWLEPTEETIPELNRITAAAPH